MKNYIQNLLKLHEFNVAGKIDTDEADVIREDMAKQWLSLSQIERKLMDELGEKLFVIISVKDVITWWDKSTQEEKYELLTRLGSENVSEDVWYVYPEMKMSQEKREELSREFDEWKSNR
jgi:hypothetical protein